MKKTSLKWSNFVINTAEISPSHTGWEPLVYFYRIVVHWITPTRCLYFKNCIYILRPETYGNELRADAFWNAAYIRVLAWSIFLSQTVNHITRQNRLCKSKTHTKRFNYKKQHTMKYQALSKHTRHTLVVTDMLSQRFTIYIIPAGAS